MLWLYPPLPVSSRPLVQPAWFTRRGRSAVPEVTLDNATCHAIGEMRVARPMVAPWDTLWMGGLYAIHHTPLMRHRESVLSALRSC